MALVARGPFVRLVKKLNETIDTVSSNDLLLLTLFWENTVREINSSVKILNYGKQYIKVHEIRANDKESVQTTKVTTA